MAILTISVPKELKQKMEKFPEINWPEVLARRLEARAKQLLAFEDMRKRGVI
jgi:hypothetical protein